MKVGSLVELIIEKWPFRDYKHLMTYPVKNKTYTIRGFITQGSQCGLYLEEIDNSNVSDLTDQNLEPAFHPGKFRELQPPIANIEEHINENTLTPELV